MIPVRRFAFPTLLAAATLAVLALAMLPDAASAQSAINPPSFRLSDDGQLYLRWLHAGNNNRYFWRVAATEGGLASAPPTRYITQMLGWIEVLVGPYDRSRDYYAQVQPCLWHFRRGTSCADWTTPIVLQGDPSTTPPPRTNLRRLFDTIPGGPINALWLLPLVFGGFAVGAARAIPDQIAKAALPPAAATIAMGLSIWSLELPTETFIALLLPAAIFGAAGWALRRW